MNNLLSPLSPERREFLNKLIESRKEISSATPVELTDFLKIDGQLRQVVKVYIDILEDKIIRSLCDGFPSPPDPKNKFVFSFRGRIDARYIAEQLAINPNIPFPILHIASNQMGTDYGTEIELFTY